MRTAWFALPQAVSGDNSYWWWGPGNPRATTVMAVMPGPLDGAAAAYLRQFFASVRAVATAAQVRLTSGPERSPSYDQSVTLPPAQPVRGVIMDWGGVLTSPIMETVDAWLSADRIDPSSYREVMRLWVAQAYAEQPARNPIHALERGECSDADFEQALARHLVCTDGSPVAAEGLLSRMFAASALDEAMLELLRGLRRAGLKTALLSNSWGRDGYPRRLFGELFDAVVISSEVGMRKPEARIFAHTARLLGLEPGECVFIDDAEANIAAARAAGFLAVHHRNHELTARQLSGLLAIPLAPPPGLPGGRRGSPVLL